MNMAMTKPLRIFPVVFLVICIGLSMKSQTQEETLPEIQGNRPIRKDTTLTPISWKEMLLLCQDTTELWCEALNQRLAPFQPQQCKPTNVGFCKTRHTSGSGVMANILLRRGLAMGWKAFIGIDKEREKPWDKHWIEHKKINLIAELCSENKKAKSILESSLKLKSSETLKGGTKKRFLTVLGRKAAMVTWIEDPYLQVRNTYEKSKHKSEKGYGEFLTNSWDNNKDRTKFNGQIQDLGFATTENYEKAMVKADRKILELDRDFDFVGIGGERFEESMVLMSTKLCYPITDFTSLPQDIITKSTGGLVLTAKEQDRLKQELRLDLMLHENFSKKLETEIDSFGREKMAVFIQQLKELNKYSLEKCEIERIRTHGEPTNYRVGLNTTQCLRFGCGLADMLILFQEEMKRKWFREQHGKE